MKAVIMAGGEGTRLRPLTCNRPKPLVPAAGIPVMEHIVFLLKNHGVTDIAATLQYLPDHISDYFGDGSSYDVRLRYYVEHKPLGTAGSVRNAAEFLDDVFLVISGDALTDVDISDAVRFHREHDAMATLILKRVDVPLEYGVVVTDNEGRIIRFLEKPGWGEVFSDTVNTGIYILSPEIFDYYDEDQVFDFSKDLFPILLKEKKRMYGYITDDYWCDIGDINAYFQANYDILDGKVKVRMPGREIKQGVWAGPGTIIENTASIEAPCVIGAGCYIRHGAVIGSYSVIGDGCTVGERSSIKKSILWKNSTIGNHVELRGCIVCSRSNVADGVSAFEDSVIGESSNVGERVLIRPSVRIWPGKTIEQCTEIGSNIVWGSRTGRQLFGNRGVCGAVNIDITPEFAAKLGASFGAAVKNKGAVGVSCDGTAASVMIKNALISGLLSSGVHVNDYKTLLLPALRSAVRFYRLDGAIHTGMCTGSRTRLALDFLDKTGSSIDRSLERKIETIFARDDFSRCEGDCLKGITEIPGFGDYYVKNIINEVKSTSLDLKIALKGQSEYVMKTVSDLLTELGCSVARMQDTEHDPAYGTDTGQFCRFVKNNGFDLGVSIEDSCEKMMLVDSRGRLVTEDMFIALITHVLFKKLGGGTVIVPVSATWAIERIAEEYNGNVVRTKTDPRDMMGKLLGADAKRELLEQFTMHFDAAAGLVKLLDFMAENKIGLDEMIDRLPDIHIRRKEVECSWSAKGKVIRKIIQENCANRIEMLEGVKVYDKNGWVLVLPDSERPVCNVIGEGYSEEFAEELTNLYVRKVREISRS